jgi:hypothetical protein
LHCCFHLFFLLLSLSLSSGILGFNYAVGHISPIVFSTVQLLDPGLAGIMSAVGGVEGWPVTSTYIGVALVTLGIFLVVVYQTKREMATAAAKAARAAMLSADGPSNSHEADISDAKHAQVEMQELDESTRAATPTSQLDEDVE